MRKNTIKRWLGWFAIGLVITVIILTQLVQATGGFKGQQAPSAEQTQTGSQNAGQDTSDGLPTEQMGNVIEAYYRLNPDDTSESVQKRATDLKMLPPEVLKSLQPALLVGSASAYDKARLDNKLTRTGTPDFAKMQVINTDNATTQQRYVIVPVTVELKRPDGSTYEGNQLAPGVTQTAVFFTLSKSGDKWVISNFGDGQNVSKPE